MSLAPGRGTSTSSRRLPVPVAVGLVVVGALAAGWEMVRLLRSALAANGSFPFLDLQVYRAGVHYFASGQPLYSGSFTDVRLPFTYPPFGVLALAFTSLGTLHQSAAFLTTLDTALVLAIGVVCSRSSLRPAGAGELTCLAVGLGMTAVLLRLEPVRATVGFGQVNILLCGIVVLDALVVPVRFRGILTGLATAVKLTPAVFVLYFLLTGRRRAAALQVASAVVASVLSIAAAPGSSWRFWTSLVISNRVGPAWFTSNQSWRGVVSRIDGPGRAASLSWLALSLVTVVLACWAIRRTHLAGAGVLAFGLCGLLGLLVSPISWSHHWVWALPALVAAVCDRVHWSVRLVGVALGLVLWVAPEWHMPNTANKEFDWAWWQQIVGNLNVWTALALVVVAGLTARSRLARPAEVGG